MTGVGTDTELGIGAPNTFSPIGALHNPVSQVESNPTSKLVWPDGTLQVSHESPRTPLPRNQRELGRLKG